MDKCLQMQERALSEHGEPSASRTPAASRYPIFLSSRKLPGPLPPLELRFIQLRAQHESLFSQALSFSFEWILNPLLWCLCPHSTPDGYYWSQWWPSYCGIHGKLAVLISLTQEQHLLCLVSPIPLEAVNSHSPRAPCSPKSLLLHRLPLLREEITSLILPSNLPSLLKPVCLWTQSLDLFFIQIFPSNTVKLHAFQHHLYTNNSSFPFPAPSVLWAFLFMEHWCEPSPLILMATLELSNAMTTLLCRWGSWGTGKKQAEFGIKSRSQGQCT